MRKGILFIIGLTYVMGTSAQNDTKRETYVYSIKGQDTLTMDVYTRPLANIEKKRPAMIYIHGGAWSAGSTKNVAQEIYNRHFAEQGFVSISINYRLGLAEGNTYGTKNLSEVVRLGTVDLIDATNYILNHADEWCVDSAKILISGGSAGAINCLQLEYDICNQKPYTKALPKDFNYAGIASHAGCIEMENDTLVWQRKPCPILFIHGSNDNAVPFNVGPCISGNWGGTFYIHKQLEAMNVPHWTYIVKGADHVMAMKALTDNLEEHDRFYRAFVEDKSQAIVNTEWAEVEPASMASVDLMVKNAPFYILGFGKYMEEMDWNNMQKPQDVVY